MAAGAVTADGRVRVLADGNEMPMLGLGVWQTPDGPECVNAVRWALELGYRHIDTAQAYGNEQSVGQGLRESGVPREEVFITTKFYPGGKDPAAEAEQSLRRLGVDQLDLYIIHWPKGGPTWAWPGMERARELGHARSIGVSNFDVDELEQVIGVASTAPVVDQVQFSPFVYRRALLDGVRERGIALEAYSPLGTGRHLVTRPWRGSRSASAAPPRRCCCAGAFSATWSSSPSPRTASASRRTRRSSTSPCQTRTWPSSTAWMRPAGPAGARAQVVVR